MKNEIGLKSVGNFSLHEWIESTQNIIVANVMSSHFENDICVKCIFYTSLKQNDLVNLNSLRQFVKIISFIKPHFH